MSFMRYVLTAECVCVHECMMWMRSFRSHYVDEAGKQTNKQTNKQVNKLASEQPV